MQQLVQYCKSKLPEKEESTFSAAFLALPHQLCSLRRLQKRFLIPFYILTTLSFSCYFEHTNIRDNVGS
jgi:hypothetical protein